MWPQENLIDCPEIENTKEQIMKLLEENDKEILVNAVRIRIINQRLATEKNEERLLKLNSLLKQHLTDKSDLYAGREILREWQKEAAKAKK